MAVTALCLVQILFYWRDLLHTLLALGADWVGNKFKSSVKNRKGAKKRLFYALESLKLSCKVCRSKIPVSQRCQEYFYKFSARIAVVNIICVFPYINRQ